MLLSRAARRLTAWGALLSLLWVALLPAITPAVMAGHPPADWLEVCSVSGKVWVQADTGEVSDSAPLTGHPAVDLAQGCEGCLMHGGDAVGPAQGRLLTLAWREAQAPPRADVAPVLAHAGAYAKPRAPPVSL